MTRHILLRVLEAAHGINYVFSSIQARKGYVMPSVRRCHHTIPRMILPVLQRRLNIHVMSHSQIIVALLQIRESFQYVKFLEKCTQFPQKILANKDTQLLYLHAWHSGFELG